MTEKRIVTDPIETLALLDLALAQVRAARDTLLPVRLPVAMECCYLTRTLDGLSFLRRDLLASLEESPNTEGCSELLTNIGKQPAPIETLRNVLAARDLLIALEYAHEILGRIYDGEEVSNEEVGSTLQPSAEAITKAKGEIA